jgi:hypothetical protein
VSRIELGEEGEGAISVVTMPDIAMLDFLGSVF